MSQSLESILSRIGENEKLRNSFLEWCKTVESGMDYSGSVRDDMTKVLVDAVFSNVPFAQKSLSNGLKFEFIPNVHSKVAREFILSTPSVPNHVWEPQTTKLLTHLSSKAKNVIVGGAYFGDQVIIIAKEIEKNKGTVHAFELNKVQSSVLKTNVQLNELSNVEVVNKGLWSDFTTNLDLSNDDDLASAVPTAGGQAASNTDTIDHYLSSKGLDTVELIMLDIEGSEYDALKGAEHQLAKSASAAPNLVFEVHRHYVDWSAGLHNTEIVRFLTDLGYTVFAVRDIQGNFDLKGHPVELIPADRVFLEGPPHGFNVLGIKDKSIVSNSLFKVVPDVSPKYIFHKDPSIHHPVDFSGKR